MSEPTIDPQDDRRVYFNEITWPNGQVELHPLGGGEPILVRGPTEDPNVRARQAALFRNAFRGVDFARGVDETGITIVPRDPADADLAEAASAIASRVYQDTAATMTLDVIVRAIIANLDRRGDPLRTEVRRNGWNTLVRLEQENAALRAEVAELRAAAGWSNDNAPALGGSAVKPGEDA